MEPLLFAFDLSLVTQALYNEGNIARMTVSYFHTELLSQANLL